MLHRRRARRIPLTCYTILYRFYSLLVGRGRASRGCKPEYGSCSIIERRAYMKSAIVSPVKCIRQFVKVIRKACQHFVFFSNKVQTFQEFPCIGRILQKKRARNDFLVVKPIVEDYIETRIDVVFYFSTSETWLAHLWGLRMPISASRYRT